jgi:hypothetical protein
MPSLTTLARPTSSVPMCVPPQCSPCTLPPRHVCPSQPFPTTLPRPSVISVPHTHLPTRFATPHASFTGTEDSPSPPPSPVLLDAFSLLHTTSPLPHTTFPLSPTYSRFAFTQPLRRSRITVRFIQTTKIHPLRPSCALLTPHPFLLTLAPPSSCYGNLFYPPSPTSCTRLLFQPCPSPSPMGPSSPLNPAATYTFPVSRFPSPFGPPLTPSSHTHFLLSPPSFKLHARVSSPPPRSLSLPQETRHPFSLALNKLMRTCGDSTYHPHLPLNPHLTPPHLVPLISAFSINPTTPPISNLKA